MVKKLSRLGITHQYNAEDNKLVYEINVNRDGFQNPKNRLEYFSDVVMAISEDAKRQEGLDKLVINIENKSRLELMEVSKELVSKAEDQHGLMLDAPNTGMVMTGAILAGLPSLIYSYDFMSSWATKVSTSINDASYLWAPISGILQAGISLVGTATLTIVGGSLGLFGFAFLNMAYRAIKNPLSTKESQLSQVSRYLSKPQPEAN